MQLITITGATGVGPYNIYVCDITLTTCVQVASSTPIPPSYSFYLPNVFVGVNQVIVKLLDLSDGCEYFNIYYCNFPSNTPTITPTVTRTSL